MASASESVLHSTTLPRFCQNAGPLLQYYTMS